jgi:PAS domain S-box-containing protein
MPQQLEEPCDMTASGQLHFSAEAEAQWRELFEYSPVMYFMVDPAGTVLAVNTFGAAQLGYSVSELVGQSVLKVFFPDDKAAAGKNLQLCVQTAGQQNKWEIRKVRKDGTLLWVRENAKAVRRSDGNLIVLIACEDISDQKRGEQRLAAQSGVSRVLAESDSLAEASPHLLRTICEAMDWDWGALWSVRQQQPERLRCDCIWHASSIDVSEFDAASQKSACAPGEGRAGQVWKTRQSLWIADVAKDPGFRRGPAAARSGLHTGLACPILLGGEALGIVEFFSRRIREPDEQELATLSAIGSQIGQFIRRKRAEQAVQASEKRFRALIEHAYDIVLLLSAEGTILYASPSVERVLGYAPEEVIGRDGYELVHPDHRQSSVTRFTRSVQELGSVITGERLLLHKDGSSRWVENVIVNLLAEPSVQAVVMRQRDVTERKQAEAALRESEQRFRTLVQFSFDVYWESDAQHRFTRQEFAEGLADAPVPGSDIGIGKTRWELPHLEPGEEAWRKHRETLDAHLPFRDFELARPRPNGGKRYWSVSGLPVFDETGRFVGYRGLGRQITDRKQAEAALRESEQRFRDYAEIASDWFWESDSEHRFTSFTRSAATWGFIGDRIGKRRWELAADRDEEPEKWRAHIATMDAHQPFRGFRYRAAAPDGSSIYVSVSGKPVFDADGSFLGYRGVATDVSAEVRGEQAERALLEAQTELAHVVRVTTLGELTASIAHEVNQPLAAVVTNAGAGLRLLDVPDLAEAREALSCIISDANRAADVIARIRALTRKTPFQKQQVDLNDVVREVAGLTRTEMDRNRVELRTELADDLPPVQADRIELQQLVLNLIVNAIEAMSDGARRDLLIASKKDDANNVRVSVCDSGRGLDPAAADRIFQPFYTTKPGGMGMGLAICRSILERLGGRLSTRANAPCGTIFEFRIPIERAS